MSNIKEKKRISEIVEKVVTAKKAVLNPDYSEHEYISSKRNGYRYYVKKYIQMNVPILKAVRTSHVAYLIECEQCKAEVWVKRCDCRTCSPACRKAAYLARQAAKGTNKKG